MSKVTYNGITLDLVGTEIYSKKAIFDGPTYLYTRHTLSVTGIFNPSLNAYKVVGDNVVLANNDATPVLAPQTDAAIRHALMQPRGLLQYVNGTNTVLVSPLPFGGANNQADETGGPYPDVEDVFKVAGTKTFFVRFTIRTDVNECFDRIGHGLTNSPILSNQWVAQSDFDEHFMETRVYRGRTVFSLTTLLALGLAPDNFRNSLVPPVSDGFKREKTQLILSQDNTTVDWVVMDVQQAVSLIIGRNVTKMEAVHSDTIEYIGLERQGVAVFEAWRNAILESERLMALNPNPVVGGPGAAVYLASGITLNTIMTVYNTLPVRKQKVVVQVWGNANATRKALHDIAFKVVVARITNNGSLLAFYLRAGLAGVRYQATHDVMRKYVSIDCEILGAPLSTIGFSVSDLLGGGFFPDDDGVPDITSSSQAANPSPPFGITQGTDIRGIFAAALAAPCQVFSPPPAALNHTETPLPPG